MSLVTRILSFIEVIAFDVKTLFDTQNNVVQDKQTNLEELEIIKEELSTARGSRSSLDKRITTISNFASPNAGGVIVGQYYDNAYHASGSTLVSANNRMELAPFFTSQRMRIDQIGFSVSTAVAGEARCVIYDTGPDGWPDQLLLSVDVQNTGTTNYRFGSCDFTFESGRQYWLGRHTESAPTLRTINLTSAVNLGLGSSSSSTYATAIRRVIPYSNGAPLQWGFNTAERTLGTTPPSIRFRAAANTPDFFRFSQWSLTVNENQLIIGIDELPYSGDLVITDIQYSINGGEAISLTGTTIGERTLLLTSGVKSVRVRLVNAIGPSQWSEPRTRTIGGAVSITGVLIVPPTNFDWSPPINIYRNGNNVFTDYNSANWMVSNTVSLWVKSTGNDTTGTGTELNPYRTIHKAILSMTGPTTIYVETGIYDRNNSIKGQAINYPLNLIAVDGEVISSSRWEGGTWTLTTNGTYTTTRSAVANVIDEADLSEFNIGFKLKKVDTQALCEAEAGTWAIVGSSLWVHRNNGSIPDTNVLVMLDVANMRITGDHKIYCHGINFEGGSSGGAFRTDTTLMTSASQIVLNQCKTTYSVENGFAPWGAGLVIINQHISYGNKFDGLNYHRGPINLVNTKAIEIDCLSYGNGNKEETNGDSNNATTSHEGCYVVRVKTIGRDCKGPLFADVDQAKSWNINCVANNSRALYNNNSMTGYYATGTAQQWLDNCTESGSLNPTYVSSTASILARFGKNAPLGTGVYYGPGEEPSRGPELVLNGDFTLGASEWLVTGSDINHFVTFENNAARYYSTTTSPVVAIRQTMLNFNTEYEIIIVIRSHVSGAIKTESFGGSLQLADSAGRFVFSGIATNSNLEIMRNSTNVDMVIESISVKEKLY